MIGRITTHDLTKQQLIDIIEKNFPDDRGHIAVVTDVYERGQDNVTGQTITFEKVLEGI